MKAYRQQGLRNTEARKARIAKINIKLAEMRKAKEAK